MDERTNVKNKQQHAVRDIQCRFGTDHVQVVFHNTKPMKILIWRHYSWFIMPSGDSELLPRAST